MIFKKARHFFKRHLCIKNIYIDGSGGGLMPALKCSKCGREIGFLYSDHNGWKSFLHFEFKRYKFEIERWVYEHTKERNHMGKSSEREWGEILHNLKQWRKDGVLSVGCEVWDSECEEDSESGESNGFGEKYEDELDNQIEENTDMIEVDCRECVNCDMEANKCVIHGADPTNAVSKCVANGFNNYEPKQ